jgi:hypothetical protein
MIGEIIDGLDDLEWIDVLDYLDEHCSEEPATIESLQPVKPTFKHELIVKLLPANVPSTGVFMKPLNKKLNYLMSEDLFEQILIDETKCSQYYKD